ncbi:MAG: hypothetical protein PHT77_10205 [Bacteroidales bacterium]|nr:hypothetical protein [Bacteroidales bacterium]
METAIITYQDMEKMAKTFVESGFFKDTKDFNQALVKIMAGKEIGLSPFASMAGINIIEGKVALSANALAVCVKRSGQYNYEIVTQTDKECTIKFGRFNGECMIDLGKSTFTMDEAKRAGLDKKSNWLKYPSDMLFARALTRGVRRFCPDAVGTSVYTPEELGADEPINITPQSSPIVEHAKKIQDEDDESNVIPNNPLPYTKKSQHYDPATNDNPHLLYPGIELAETPYATLESIMAKAMKDGNGKEVQGIINQIYPEFYLQDIMVEDIPDAKVIEIVERLTGVRMEAN